MRGGEVFSDFNSNGTWDDENHPSYTGFNGLLCDPAATEGCNANDTLFVSDQIVVVLSSSFASIFDDVGGSIDIVGVAQINVTVSDINGNPMSGGTVVRATTSNGTIAGPSTYTTPCSNFDGALVYPFNVEADSTPDSGVMTIEVQTPSGQITTHSIIIND